MQEHDRRAFALLADEARDAAGLEAPPGGPMDLDRLAGGVAGAIAAHDRIGAASSDPAIRRC